MENHSLSQPTISDHLRILRNAQLVNFREEYPYTFYSLHLDHMVEAQKLITDFFKILDL